MPLVLPCTNDLKSALEEAKQSLGATPIAARPTLTQLNGNPINYFYMAKVMRKEHVRLGLEAYDLHALPIAASRNGHGLDAMTTKTQPIAATLRKP